MRAERDRTGLKMSDQEIQAVAEKMAPLVTVGMLDGFRQEGVFDQPPEAPQPPANQEPAIAGEPPAAPPEEAGPAQGRRTFAHRYMGIRE
jgi:hypothetical protein